MKENEDSLPHPQQILPTSLWFLVFWPPSLAKVGNIGEGNLEGGGKSLAVWHWTSHANFDGQLSHGWCDHQDEYEEEHHSAEDAHWRESREMLFGWFPTFPAAKQKWLGFIIIKKTEIKHSVDNLCGEINIGDSLNPQNAVKPYLGALASCPNWCLPVRAGFYTRSGVPDAGSGVKPAFQGQKINCFVNKRNGL